MKLHLNEGSIFLYIVTLFICSVMLLRQQIKVSKALASVILLKREQVTLF